ncbi:hypothetical protein RRG08_063651 [Elysia crispata]|uniref:Uncharacterized protein n=1 Tax=Elysia crispata TaxID=231223 RepID=A0AAE0Y775_9GAST|nr:hypothetical protein RRG08_063651 [Elysia crispata]
MSTRQVVRVLPLSTDRGGTHSPQRKRKSLLPNVLNSVCGMSNTKLSSQSHIHSVQPDWDKTVSLSKYSSLGDQGDNLNSFHKYIGNSEHNSSTLGISSEDNLSTTNQHKNDHEYNNDFNKYEKYANGEKY